MSRLKQPCSPCSLFDNFLPIFPLHSQRIFKCHNEIWGKGIDFRCPKIILVGLCEAHKTLGGVAMTDFWAVFAGTRYVPLCQGNYNRKLSEVVQCAKMRIEKGNYEKKKKKGKGRQDCAQMGKIEASCHLVPSPISCCCSDNQNLSNIFPLPFNIL